MLYLVTVEAFDVINRECVELETLERGCKESAKRKALEWLSGNERYELTEVIGIRKL